MRPSPISEVIRISSPAHQDSGQKPSLIYVPGYYTEAGLIARQMRQLGMDQPILGTDGFHSPNYSRSVGMQSWAAISPATIP